MYRFTLSSAVLVGLAVFLVGCVEQPAETGLDLHRGTWVDLTHEFSSETVYWPTAEPFELDTVFYGMSDAGFFYSAFSFRGAEHGGTHLDAPIHFSAGMRTVSQIPPDELVGPGAVLNLIESVGDNADYLVSVDDILAWESENGPVPDGAMVFLYTGHGRFWPDPKLYLGTDVRGPDAVPLLHFPGLDPEAARWLVSNRSIRGIGIDTPSIDFGQSSTFEAHQVLAGQNILIFENVANLSSLPVSGFWVIAAPMKIEGGSGGPLRLLSFIPSDGG